MEDAEVLVKVAPSHSVMMPRLVESQDLPVAAGAQEGVWAGVWAGVAQVGAAEIGGRNGLSVDSGYSCIMTHTILFENPLG